MVSERFNGGILKYKHEHILDVKIGKVKSIMALLVFPKVFKKVGDVPVNVEGNPIVEIGEGLKSVCTELEDFVVKEIFSSSAEEDDMFLLELKYIGNGEN